jgi:hypothetical protein
LKTGSRVDYICTATHLNEYVSYPKLFSLKINNVSRFLKIKKKKPGGTNIYTRIRADFNVDSGSKRAIRMNSSSALVVWNR